MRILALALCFAGVAGCVSQARSRSDDPFPGVYRSVQPSVVLITMLVPPEGGARSRPIARPITPPITVMTAQQTMKLELQDEKHELAVDLHARSAAPPAAGGTMAQFWVTVAGSW